MLNSPKFSEISLDELVAGSLNRATAFVNTNGMIQVTLCGLFATTISVLIALAESAENTASPQIYGRIIPVFSFVIFTVSIQVYSWIDGQLEYLSKYGRKLPDSTSFLTYEEFIEQIYYYWEKRPKLIRTIQLTKGILVFYFTIPFRMENVYCYYFVLYAVTPFFTLFVASDSFDFFRSVLLLMALQLSATRIGLAEVIIKNIVKKEGWDDDSVAAQLCEDNSTTSVENGTT